MSDLTVPEAPDVCQWCGDSAELYWEPLEESWACVRCADDLGMKDSSPATNVPKRTA